MEICDIGSNVQSELCSKDSSARNPTITERLTQKKYRLETELKSINEALDALNAYPEIHKVLSLISKIGY